jgi:hypothetical protein
MNKHIENLSDRIKRRYLRAGVRDAKQLITVVRAELNEIKSEKDRIDLLTQILEENELKYQEHLQDCTNLKECKTNKNHDEVNYLLRQELEELGIVASDNFTYEEKEKCNEKLEEIIQNLIFSNELVHDQLELLKSEIEELKTMYVLGKKNWRQQFAGKMKDMVTSGVITHATAEPIIENVLKPGVQLAEWYFIGG